MSVVVLLFAGLRDRIGERSLRIAELDRASTVRVLVDRLKQRYPILERYPFTVAVNGRYGLLEQELNDGDEVALIPPVSGG